jgi:hypothetical protein
MKNGVYYGAAAAAHCHRRAIILQEFFASFFLLSQFSFMTRAAYDPFPRFKVHCQLHKYHFS